MIQTDTNKDIYLGDGTTRRFEVSFDYETKNNVKQIDLFTCTYTTEDGTTKYNNDVTPITSNYDFEVVDGVTYVVYPSDAAVSDGATPMSAGTAIIVLRDTPQEQLTTGQYNSERVEKEFDKLTMIAQDLQEQLNRSYKAPKYADSVDEADFVTVAQSIDNINDVAENLTDIDTVKNNLTDITTVATNISDVNAVGQNISDINDVATNITDISTVADDISSVTDVADNIQAIVYAGENIADISAVAGNLTDISTVADKATDVTTVASISTAVSNVSDNESNINTVADNLANVNTVASNMNSVLAVSGDISNVNTVASNTTNINTVAGISSDVTTVAGIASDVTDVKNNATNITTVATNISNVNTAATNISNINTAASNMAAIIAAPTAAQNAATSETNAQKWAEGTDADVQPLGGTKSSKGWANRAQELVESIGTVMRYKGSVANYTALQAIQNPTLGDTYNVLDTGANYAWDGTAWDEIGSAVDLSAYRTSADQDLIDATKAPNTNKVNGIPISNANAYYYAESTSAADAVEKTVSIPAITELNAGQVIIVKPTITSTVASSTLKLNDFTAYPMLYAGATISTSTDSKVWSANTPSIFVFDGSYWRFAGHGADDNTTYTLNYLIFAGTANAGVGTYAVTRYALLMQKLDGTWESLKETSTNYSTGTTKTVNTSGFIPGKITYYNTTTVKKNGEAISVSSLYLKATSVDARYSFNCGATPGWSAGDSIYVVGTIGSDGLFYLDSTTWWSNALPTTQDGKVYMYIGTYVSDAYKITLDLDHPMFYHDGTSVKPYVVAGNKQDKLVSGTNIKTVNNTSLLGSGDVTITASAAWGSITGTLSDQTDLNTALSGKADIDQYGEIDCNWLNVSDEDGSSADLSPDTLDITTASGDHVPAIIYLMGGDGESEINLINSTNETLKIRVDDNDGAQILKSDDNFSTTKSVLWEDDANLQNELDSKAPAILLSHFWSDHIINEMSYLRGDTFSWQSGDVYTAAYGHLVDDLDGLQLYSVINDGNNDYTRDEANDGTGYYAWTYSGTTVYTSSDTPAASDTAYSDTSLTTTAFTIDSVSMTDAQIETIGSYTITYYKAADKHKICLADQEPTIYNLFNTTGNARYFILDTTNTRFKLPRWRHSKYQVKAPVVGNGKTMGLTNGTQLLSFTPTTDQNNSSIAGTTTYDQNIGYTFTRNSSTDATNNKAIGLTVDPTKSGIEAILDADDMYLYFYVGTYTKTAYQETAGLNAELFNGKADTNLSNVTGTSGFRKLISANKTGNAWYKVYAEYDPSTGTFLGNWCEQGDTVTRTAAAAQTIVFPLPFADTSYTLIQNYQAGTSNGNTGENENGYYNKTTTGFTNKSTLALTYITEFAYVAYGYI